MTKRRPLALGAAATIGFGSLFFAAPALAEDTSNADAELKVTEEATAEVPTQADEKDLQAIDSAQAFEAATGGEAVAVDTAVEGGITLLVSKDKKTDEVIRYAEAAAKGEVDGVAQILFTEPAEPYAATDVVGGAGYIMDVPGGISACSIGFTAWGPQNEQALLSAGHCTGDGSAGEIGLSKPSTEPAVNGEGYESNGTGVMGEFGFYRYGGPGNNNPGADKDPASTDIAVIEMSNENLTIHPEVTNWETAGDDDLAASTVEITGVANPASGAVSKSGRTTGFTSGDTTVTLEDQAGNPVEGEILDGWVQIGGRWVHGFINDAGGAPGDSGGAVIQGDKAVGLVSGGPDDGSWMWATRLADALQQVEGDYEVAVHVDAPTLESPADGDKVSAGSDIVINAPANADSLSVSTAPNSGESVPVENGQAVIQAPTEGGTVNYSITAMSGKSFSDPLEFELEVTIAAPAITSPKEGDRLDGPVEAITGTGIEGATVTLTGDVEGEATVEDGTWSVPADLTEVGAYSVTAEQTADEETSGKRTSKFEIIPVEPEITSIEDGTVFGHEEGPTGVSGTGIPGAEVTVDLTQSEGASTMVDSADVTATVDEDGNWAADFGGTVEAGTYSLTATQTENSVVSDATDPISFEVSAAPSEADAGADGGDAGGAADGGDAGGAADGGDNGTGGDDEAGTDDGDLANTGAGSMLPFAIGAVLLLAAGGGAILIAQRRQAGAEL